MTARERHCWRVLLWSFPCTVKNVMLHTGLVLINSAYNYSVVYTFIFEHYDQGFFGRNQYEEEMRVNCLVL